MANRQMKAKMDRDRLRGLGTARRFAVECFNHEMNPVHATKLVADVTFKSNNVVTVYGPTVPLPAGKASGLSNDYGQRGKGGARMSHKTYGDGARRSAILADCWSRKTNWELLVAE